MLFNSIQFAVFLPIVFVLYWFATDKILKSQNILLLIASYIFYGWWDWRFLSLLLIVSFTNYFLGIMIDKNDSENRRRNWLIAGLIFNLGILGVFKYYNFFVDSFVELMSLVGFSLPKSTAKIILPLGISFYLFLSLSYIIDIHKRTLNANKNIEEVLLALGFFPIILAGPIQRPALLLPQIGKKREFNHDQATDGLRQILWGLFVKVVIADNLAFYVDDIFDNYTNYSGSTLLLGALFYSIQIYADFSAYSDMAIGIAKLFGFNLMRNFNYPYFARDITEFWKRWHISLTTWFRDYLFLPLSFTVSWRLKGEKVLNIKSDLFIYIVASTITWFMTGLWHGANYTFIMWGMIHGLFLIIYRWQLKPRKMLFRKLDISNDSLIIVIGETLITLTIILLAWVFFRSQNITQAVEYISKIASVSLFTIPEILPKKILILIIIFVITEWLQKEKQHALQLNSSGMPKIIRWGLYCSLILIILFSGGNQQEFIYFQF
jgi:alginate O-acetyltransferase complex protein AlgI